MIDMRDRKNRELELERYRMLLQETVDPLGTRLLADLISELEADLAADAGVIIRDRSPS